MTLLRLLTLAALTCWAAVGAAAPGPPASLTVYSEQGQPFGFVLDGRVLTRPLARQVRVGLLLPGQHWADVSVPMPYGLPLHLRTALWLQPGFDNGYVLVLRRGGPQLCPLAPAGQLGPGYGGSPGGGQYPPPGATGQYTPPPQYDGQADEEADEYSPPAPNGTPYPGGAYPNSPAPNAYPGPGATQPGGYPGGASYPGAPGGSYPAAPGPGGSYYPPEEPYLRPLAPADFSGLQQALAQRPFDAERLSIIKQALATSTVRADELATLVRDLSFDKSRTELAKFGYAHVADPQNFYRVYDALQFRASIREVQQALGLPQQ